MFIYKIVVVEIIVSYSFYILTVNYILYTLEDLK
jgi:hypothetical protein